MGKINKNTVRNVAKWKESWNGQRYVSVKINGVSEAMRRRRMNKECEAMVAYYW